VRKPIYRSEILAVLRRTPIYQRFANGGSILLVHNHPSGDPAPSKADIDMTRKIAQAAAALGMSVHDHIIVGHEGHANLKALGVM
jgi:DNA repair protein RadC